MFYNFNDFNKATKTGNQGNNGGGRRPTAGGTGYSGHEGGRRVKCPLTQGGMRTQNNFYKQVNLIESSGEG